MPPPLPLLHPYTCGSFSSEGFLSKQTLRSPEIGIRPPSARRELALRGKGVEDSPSPHF